MAWPNTPLTTYVANSTPVVKAADLNAMQDAINRFALGTYSKKALTVDGTGGAIVAPTAGRITASEKLVAGTTVVPGTNGVGGTYVSGGAPSALTAHELYAGLIPFAWGFIEASGTIDAGCNVTACSFSSNVYTLTHPGANFITLVVTPRGGTGVPIIGAVIADYYPVDNTHTAVLMKNTSGTAGSCAFSFVAFAAP